MIDFSCFVCHHDYQHVFVILVLLHDLSTIQLNLFSKPGNMIILNTFYM